MSVRPEPPFPKQRQEVPGLTRRMDPVPDYGETSYAGSGRLSDKRAIITGGDSGIGRAVAVAFAREGADLLIAYQRTRTPEKRNGWSKKLAENAS
jgi:hypothetical protein